MVELTAVGMFHDYDNHPDGFGAIEVLNGRVCQMERSCGELTR